MLRGLAPPSYQVGYRKRRARPGGEVPVFAWQAEESVAGTPQGLYCGPRTLHALHPGGGPARRSPDHAARACPASSSACRSSRLAIGCKTGAGTPSGVIKEGLMRSPKSTEKSMGRGARAAAVQSHRAGDVGGILRGSGVSPGRTIGPAPAVGGHQRRCPRRPQVRLRSGAVMARSLSECWRNILSEPTLDSHTYSAPKVGFKDMGL